MDLSVIIATYRRPHLLRKALAALAIQRVPGSLRWEVVVVDNNSRDATPEVVAEARRRSSVPVACLFEPRQGQSHALNMGIDAAAGDIIAFTDDDCQPEPTWIRDVVEVFNREELDGVGGRILPDWSARPPAWLENDIHLWMTLALQDSRTRRVVRPPGRDVEAGFGVWGANMAYRRAVFQAVGGFHTGLGPQGTKPIRSAEPELIRRVLAAGFRVVFEPSLVVRHHVGPERMVRRYFRRHRFYLGFGTARYNGAPAGPHLLGIAPYMVRLIVADAGRWARARLAGDEEAFCRQLDLMEDLGYLWGYMSAAARARRYVALARSHPSA